MTIQWPERTSTDAAFDAAHQLLAPNPARRYIEVTLPCESAERLEARTVVKRGTYVSVCGRRDQCFEVLDKTAVDPYWPKSHYRIRAVLLDEQVECAVEFVGPPCDWTEPRHQA